MPNYYLHRDGENLGPFPLEEIKRQVAAGDILQNELVCPEGGEDWIPAGNLAKPTAPRATMLGHSHSHQSAVATMSQQKVTLQQVQDAKMKMKMPAMGMVFSIALPFILWAAKSDAERGVGVSGKNQGLKTLATNNTDLLPVAIVIGVIGFVGFFIWFRKAQRYASLLKASYEHHQG
ncbi:MAG: DUF4339 domain-containing protein [Akkermansiaceae bacterium]|nr:DUF4339 domain-containing protein [Akkermansiaceae bacterium]